MQCLCVQKSDEKYVYLKNAKKNNLPLDHFLFEYELKKHSLGIFALDVKQLKKAAGQQLAQKQTAEFWRAVNIKGRGQNVNSETLQPGFILQVASAAVVY